MSEHTDAEERKMRDSSEVPGKKSSIERRTFLGGVTAALGVAGLPATLAQSSDEQDLDAIIEQMTLDQKISRLHQNEESNIPAIPELGVPKLDMRDAPHRVRTMRVLPDSTVFPAGLSAASTFDPELVRQQGAAVARETKADDGNALLAPAVNINRVPVGGRTWEYYGEDPHLTARMAAEYTKGCQSEEVIATVKHFVANNQEAQRNSINVDVSERALREIYYPGYKAAVQDGGAAAVMSSLNKINGEYASEAEDVLVDALKDDWGFEGYVVSDFFGIYSTVDAALSGSDVELVHGAHFGDPLKQAVQDGIISEAKIDEMVRRVLWALQTTGAMDTMGTDERTADGAHGTDEHFSVAQQIAEEGSVLLKNENDVLPLDEAEIDELAIVGPEPNSFIIKADSPIRSIGLVDGIENKVDDVSINTVSTDPFRSIESDVGSPSGTDDAGFLAEYYDNEDFSGDPASTEVVEQIEVDSAADASGISGAQSIRWTTQLTAPVGGTYGFSIETPGAVTLSLDGEVVLEKEAAGFAGPFSASGEHELQEGEVYDLVLEVTGIEGEDNVYLEWDRPDVDPVREAAIAATEADATIALVQSERSEGADLEDMSLDGNQEELVHHVASATENSIALVNAGGPVRMEWIEFVSSAMHVWYPGQEGGNAVANLLFGDTNPSGKLPMTLGETMWDYPADEPSEYPGQEGAVHYDEGVFVGYRYFDEESIEPLFPFGHGESYTDFEYSNLRITPGALNPAKDSLTVEVTVGNTGDRDGAEVVQVYLEDVEASVDRPPKELVAFQRVELPAGEQTTVELELDEEAFQFYDPNNGWTIEQGQFIVHVGSSSRDIRLEDDVQVRR